MTHIQALDRLAMMQASSAHSFFKERSAPQQLAPAINAGGVPSGNAHQQMDSLSQHAQVSINDEINPLHRVIQTQNASLLRQFNMQGPQLQNDSGFPSRMPSNPNPLRMDPPWDSQGPGSMQENFPPVAYTNVPPFSAPSASQPPPGPCLANSIYDVPLSQLRALSTRLVHIVMEEEKNLRSSNEGDIQQQLRAKIEHNKLRLRALQEIINAKLRAR